ncbi:MAG: glycosyltransferase family 2 protein [Candidatus Aminicenantales bacterium]
MTELGIALSCILVNFNDRMHLEECLPAIERSARGMDFETIVVDNNSSDGSPEYVTRNFPAVQLIRNTENVGFARANNQGVKASRGEYVLFLNTDTVIAPEALNLLLRELKVDPAVGAVGPALLRKDKSFQVSFGNTVNFFSELLRKCLLNFCLRTRLKWARKKREVGWLSAACFLARKRIVEEAGGFDENFFLYFEDIDLCMRIRKKGGKLLYLPAAKVFHEGGATTRFRALQSRLAYRESQVYYYRKHNSKISLFWLRLYLRINFWVLTARGAFRSNGRDLQRAFDQLSKKDRT